jgi:hypothetical protein
MNDQCRDQRWVKRTSSKAYIKRGTRSGHRREVLMRGYRITKKD